MVASRPQPILFPPLRSAFAVVLAAWLCLLAPAPAVEARTGVPTGTMWIGDVEAVVELVLTAEDARRGLGERDAVARGTDGMLFRANGLVGFWMKGMRFCIDFVWIAGDAVIGTTEEICPSPPGTADEDLPLYFPPGDITAVLETPAGWVARHGIEAGAAVTPLLVPADTVAGMIHRAGRNDRFGENEVATVAGMLSVAGVDSSRTQTLVAARMERANAGGVNDKEVRRLMRQARALLAEAGG